MLQDVTAQDIALLRLVHARRQHRTMGASPTRPQGLVVALGGECDDLVGGRKDGWRRSVVLLQPHDPRPGEAHREIQDVANGGRTERVDGLSVIPDHSHVGGRSPHVPQDVGLQGVGVLILVDQDVIEASSKPPSGGRVSGQRSPVQEQVVVVDDVLAPLAIRVRAKDRADTLGLGPAPGKGSFEHLGQPQLGVHGARIDRDQSFLPREPAFPRRQAELAPDEVHEVGRIRLIHYGEVGPDAEWPAM